MGDSGDTADSTELTGKKKGHLPAPKALWLEKEQGRDPSFSKNTILSTALTLSEQGPGMAGQNYHAHSFAHFSVT